MPKICEFCGKEHETLEELEANARGMALKDITTLEDLPGTRTIETPVKPVKVRLKKKE